MKYPKSYLVAAAVLAFAAGAAAQTQPVVLPVVQPHHGDIIRYVTLPGTILPDQQATLYAKVGGYLGTVTVDKGDPVKKGQLLAEIEVPELDAVLKKNQADVRLAEIELQRLREARKKSPDLVIPQAVDKAEASLEISKAESQQTETMLGFARVAAPFDGVVTARYLDPGAFVPAATTGSTPQNAALFTVMNFATVRVQAAIPEVDAAFVSKGQPVRFSVEGLPGKIFQGTISRSSGALDDTTRSMLVQADIPNPDLLLRPGMYAKFGFGVQNHNNALLVPKASITMEKANAFVFKLVDGKAKKTPVKTGFDDGENVEILDGAKEGETLVISGKTSLTDGQAVQPSGQTK